MIYKVQIPHYPLALLKPFKIKTLFQGYCRLMHLTKRYNFCIKLFFSNVLFLRY